MGRSLKRLIGCVFALACTHFAPGAFGQSDVSLEDTTKLAAISPWGGVIDWIDRLCLYVPCEDNGEVLLVAAADPNAAAWAFAFTYEEIGPRSNLTQSQAFDGILDAQRILQLLNDNPKQLDPIVEEHFRASLELMQEELLYAN